MLSRLLVFGLVFVIGCAAIAPLISEIPAGISAVEQLVTAARLQGRDVAPDLLARARAIDDAAAKRAKAEAARSAATKATLDAMRADDAKDRAQIAHLIELASKPAAPCPACLVCAPMAIDGGTEGGSR